MGEQSRREAPEALASTRKAIYAMERYREKLKP
jgi:hypothetical protein